MTDGVALWDTVGEFGREAALLGWRVLDEGGLDANAMIPTTMCHKLGSRGGQSLTPAQVLTDSDIKL